VERKNSLQRLFRLQRRVTTYWPEFGQNGKDKVRFVDLITHRAGLPYFDNGPIPLENIPRSFPPHNLQLKKEFSQLLASQKPKWPLQPDVCGYHTFSVGFFIGEVVERVDPHKRSISSFLQEEICSKIGAQYFIGLPENFDEGRLSRHYTAKSKINTKDPSAKAMMDPSSLSSRSYNALKFNVWKSRNCEIPSALGFASASGLASIYSILANNGTVDGVTFIKPQTVQKVIKSIGKCKDLVLLKDSYWTQGGFRTHSD